MDTLDCSAIRRFVNVSRVIMLLLLFLTLLYFFVCSLDLLSSAFRLLGGKAAGRVFRESDLLKNPVAGLMIGVLATVLVQSSSTSTSIVVAMTNSGVMEIENAIFIIMGANIGTSITNTLVAVAQGADRNQFRLAFAGATVHDMFNWLNVLVFLPVEVISHAIFGKGYLQWITALIIDSSTGSSTTTTTDKMQKIEFLSAIVDPLTNAIIQLDKETLINIASMGESNKSIAKHYCYDRQLQSDHRCKYLFNIDISDAAIGAILLALSLSLLIGCLLGIVKILNVCLKTRMTQAVQRLINAECPFPFGWLTAYVAILVGALLTFLIQSSSVFTSALTPLVGVEVLSLERIYPLTLGSNLGTTGTAIIAALSTDNYRIALQAALCHLFFNLSGILVWFPVPILRRVPLTLARILGNTTAKYRWFAAVYIIGMFLMFPLLVFGLSAISWIALATVGSFIAAIALTVAIISLLQAQKPGCLPTRLRNWEFLPEPMRSLEPMDRVISAAIRKIGALKQKTIKQCCFNQRVSPTKTSVNQQETNIDQGLDQQPSCNESPGRNGVFADA